MVYVHKEEEISKAIELCKADLYVLETWENPDFIIRGGAESLKNKIVVLEKELQKEVRIRENMSIKFVASQVKELQQRLNRNYQGTGFFANMSKYHSMNSLKYYEEVLRIKKQEVIDEIKS